MINEGNSPEHSVRILADTGVVWDALSLQVDPKRMKGDERRLEDAGAFWQLIAEPQVEIHYTSLLDRKLSHLFPVSWGTLKPRLTRSPIPLSRADGYHKLDGSIKCGGRYGGSLRKLLPLDHADKLTAAAKHAQETGMDTEYKEHRKKEFDFEHLEAALELGASYFITTDYALLGRLRGLTVAERKSPPVLRAASIAVRPVDALQALSATGRT